MGFFDAGAAFFGAAFLATGLAGFFAPPDFAGFAADFPPAGRDGFAGLADLPALPDDERVGLGGCFFVGIQLLPLF
jgi:hypothetical protein